MTKAINFAIFAALTEADPIATIANAYNAVKQSDIDTKTLSKRGKAKLLAVIHEAAAKGLEMQKAAEAAAADKAAGNCGVMSMMTQALGNTTSMSPKTSKPARTPKAQTGEAKAPRPTIRRVSEILLKEVAYHDDDGRPFGLAYDEILALVKQQFDGAKTTVACLRWYAVHMREAGVQLPHRPRVTPVAPTKTEE